MVLQEDKTYLQGDGGNREDLQNGTCIDFLRASRDGRLAIQIPVVHV
jgi:hypothetical protein